MSVTTSATVFALAFICMNIHMFFQAWLRCKTSLALSAWKEVISVVYFTMSIQTAFPSKPFMTHGTQIRPWTVSDIVIIIFYLCLRGTPCIFTYMYTFKPHTNSRRQHKSQPSSVRFGLTTLSAQTGCIVPQKYNVYHVGQRSSKTIQLNSESIE